ncbi:GAF domain-containing protein [Mycolicibacterium sp. P1-5]|uniref:GAF domain-containing protein n=1 Tax=Mycolicibacterium sp. P1-5 TaxID=2024617 RepID=UPI0011EC5A60|nr:GAF domain-containing protein [Mycolicibacterium sp. P1-5]KAA0105123.1 GAF domain-containing protein [Mycolicibacterium sp. P1-5]
MVDTREHQVEAQLSDAERLEDVQQVVKVAARRIAGAHGATFVLLDKDMCYYADEDSMSPLWKGQRFPVSDCISGWAMIHRTSVAIGDIRRDERIPQEAYRPTFVRSLVMTPMLGPDPVGAIGVYWAHPGQPDPAVIEALKVLAELAVTALQRFPDGIADPGFTVAGR